MPALVVPAHAIRHTETWIAELARRAPEDDPNEAARRERYLAAGRAEADRRDTFEEARLRHADLVQRAGALADAGALEAVRARDVERAMAALRAPRDTPGRGDEIGALPEALERYGASVEGRRVAPPIVVESLAWARWNALHGRTLTEGMDDTLRHAYFGWLVSYGPTAGTDVRDLALAEAIRAGALRGLESEAFVRLSRDDAEGARRAFLAAFEASGNVRLRNHALSLGLAALDEGDADEAARAAPIAPGGSR